MSATSTGILAGLLLAIAAAIGGWSAFALAVFLGTIGGFVGAQVTGRVDVVSLISTRNRG